MRRPPVDVDVEDNEDDEVAASPVFPALPPFSPKQRRSGPTWQVQPGIYGGSGPIYGTMYDSQQLFGMSGTAFANLDAAVPATTNVVWSTTSSPASYVSASSLLSN